MDWIESWFGISPDDGDGSVELLLAVLAVAAIFIVALMFNRWLRSWFRRLVATIVPGVLREP